jgi:hypothetical protein
LVYGQNRQEAIAKVQALALRVLADQLEHQDNTSESITISLIAA